MWIKYFDPYMTREVFEDEWLRYTKAAIYNARHSLTYRIPIFIDDLRSTEDWRMDNTISLSLARLYEKLGRNNAGIRKYKAFKRAYINTINSIWKDYYVGIRGCQLPSCGNRAQWADRQTLDYIRETNLLRFFDKHKGKNISKILKPMYRHLWTSIAEDDFRTFKELAYKKLSERGKAGLFWKLGYDTDFKEFLR